jgi:hypothetical protein
MVTIKHPRMRKTLARGTAKGERGLPTTNYTDAQKSRDILGQRRSAVKMKDFADEGFCSSAVAAEKLSKTAMKASGRIHQSGGKSAFH